METQGAKPGGKGGKGLADTTQEDGENQLVDLPRGGHSAFIPCHRGSR